MLINKVQEAKRTQNFSGWLRSKPKQPKSLATPDSSIYIDTFNEFGHQSRKKIKISAAEFKERMFAITPLEIKK